MRQLLDMGFTKGHVQAAQAVAANTTLEKVLIITMGATLD
jgi:hypothetical protein